MKKITIIVSCMFLLLLSGCSSYTRDTSAGKVENITVEQMEKKIKNKETFTVLFSQSWCGHCQKFLLMMEDYLPKHNVLINDVVIDKDPITDDEKKIKLIQSYFPSLKTTPILYYVKDGEVVSELTPGDEGLTEERFDSWVQKNKIDEKVEK